MSKFVLPQFDGPAIIHRIEFGNKALCLFDFAHVDEENSSSTFRIGIVSSCLVKRILNETTFKISGSFVLYSVSLRTALSEHLHKQLENNRFYFLNVNI